MKSYIVTTEYKKASYCMDCKIRVYRVKRNVPEYIGEGSFNTGGSKGVESEAYKVLYESKEVSKQDYKATSGYYRSYDNDKLVITHVGA